MMSKVEYKIRKVKVDGVIKIVPLRRKTVLGFGSWKIDPDWDEAEAALAAEKLLGLNDDSTLVYISKFIEKRAPSTHNKYYE